jgi:hypothetical protein
MKHHNMKRYWGGGIAPPFLTSALDEGEWSASGSGRCTPVEKSVYFWLGGWLGARTNLDDVKMRRILILSGSEVSQDRSQSLYRLRYPGSLWFTQHKVKQKVERGHFYEFYVFKRYSVLWDVMLCMGRNYKEVIWYFFWLKMNKRW